MLALFSSLRAVSGIRFVIDREECFSHNVEYEGDTVHVSFVVIKSDAAWHYSDDGVDLLVSLIEVPRFFVRLITWSCSKNLIGCDVISLSGTCTY